MTEINEPFIGITDERGYYEGGIGGIRSVEKTIKWDQKLVRRVPNAKTFLLAGCSQPRSIGVMVDFISQNYSNAINKKLFVADIGDLAISKIKKWQQEHENVSGVDIQIIQGNILHLPLLEESVDYIRLDSTQNFVKFSDQEKFTGELARVLSKNGIISNVVKVVDQASVHRSMGESWWRAGNPPSPFYLDGCMVRKDDYYDLLMLSSKKIKDISRKLKLKCEFGESLAKSREGWFKTQHVILSKQKSHSFFG